MKTHANDTKMILRADCGELGLSATRDHLPLCCDGHPLDRL